MALMTWFLSSVYAHCLQRLLVLQCRNKIWADYKITSQQRFILWRNFWCAGGGWYQHYSWPDVKSWVHYTFVIYLGTTSDVTKGGLLGLAGEIELHVEPVDDEDDEKYWIGTMLKSPGFFKKYQFSRQTKSLTFSNWCRIFTRSKAMLYFLFLGSQFLFSFTSSSSISIPGLGGSVDKPNLTSFVKCDIDAKINLVKLV